MGTSCHIAADKETSDQHSRPLLTARKMFGGGPQTNCRIVQPMAIMASGPSTREDAAGHVRLRLSSPRITSLLELVCQPTSLTSQSMRQCDLTQRLLCSRRVLPNLQPRPFPY